MTNKDYQLIIDKYGKEKLKELACLINMTEAGVVKKLLSMSEEELLKEKEKKHIIFKLEDGNYYNRKMISALSGLSASSVWRYTALGRVHEFNRFIFGKKQVRYNRVPYEDYPKVSKETLQKAFVRYKYDSQKVDEWYKNKLRTKRNRFYAHKISITFNGDEELIYTQITKGYPIRDVIKVCIANTKLSSIGFIVKVDGTYKTVETVCKEKRYNVVRLRKDVNEYGVLEVESRINNGYYNNNKNKESKYKVKVNDISYDLYEVAKLLNISYNTARINYIKDKDKLKQRLESALINGKPNKCVRNEILLPEEVPFTKKELITLYKVSLGTLNHYIKRAKGDHLHIYYLLEQYRFRSVEEYTLCGVSMRMHSWAKFLNTNAANIYWYKRNSNDDDLINSYHIKERLLFKDNSPYSTWFADDTWIYECPVCKRRLLMSTDELINYKHDEELCKEYELEGD